MSDTFDSRVYPLPLVAFERYMLLDDRDDYPSDFFLRLVFRGSVDRDDFDAALKTTLPRHPLQQALVRETARGGVQWVAAEELRPLVEWGADVGPSTCRNGPRIDLRREVGLRIFLRPGKEGTEALFQFHHATTDGLGAMRLINDLLAAYHGQFGSGEAPALPPLDPRRLHVRGKFGMTWWKYLARAPVELAGALGIFEYLGHRPVAVPSTNDAAPRPSGEGRFPGTCAHTFDIEQTAALKVAAKRHGCSTNTVLLRDLYLALHAWIAEHEPSSRKRVIRIMVPTNFRVPDDEAMPAANVVSMVYLDRRCHKYDSPEALLHSVRRELRLLLRWRMGLTLIHYIRLSGLIPGLLAKLLPGDRCVATAVLSNLGDPTGGSELPNQDGHVAPGDVVLRSIEAFPPVRPMTRTSFGLAWQGGKLTVALNYDVHHFTEDEGAALLRGFVERIGLTLQGCKAAGQKESTSQTDRARNGPLAADSL